MLECGLPWRTIQRQLGFQTVNIDGCLVSHEHGDHARGMLQVCKAGIDVYATQGTLGALGCKSHHRLLPVSTGESYMINKRWAVHPFDTVHDAQEPVGFSIYSFVSEDNLIFLTDTAWCKYRFGSPSVIMIEANFSEEMLRRNVLEDRLKPSVAKRIRENHMSIERVIDFLKANDLRRCRAIHLLHLSDGNSDAKLFQRMVQEATGIPTYVEG